MLGYIRQTQKSVIFKTVFHCTKLNSKYGSVLTNVTKLKIIGPSK